MSRQSRMLSTCLDHQKGTKLWVHDAAPRHYGYHPFSTAVTGITPEGRAGTGPGVGIPSTVGVMSTVAVRGGRGVKGSSSGEMESGAAAEQRGIRNDAHAGGRGQLATSALSAGAREVKTESHTLYHTPYYQNNGMC